VETETKTTAVKGDIKINGRIIRAIIDTGAAISVITKTLLNDLQMEIKESSNSRLVGFDGNKSTSLGKSEIEIELQNWLIPITVEVIDSNKRDLIIGTKSLVGMDANIDLKENKLTLKVNDEDTIEIPIYYTQNENVNNEISDNEDDYDTDDSEKPIEYEEIKSDDKNEQVYSVKVDSQD
jgi:gag-polyprotein putative aspartyl protease